MKLFVTAKPGAGEDSVEKIDETHFLVAVREPPVKGRANAAIARALADFLGVASSRVRLTSGFTSRQKVFEVQ
jgi:uncharacterized protein